MTSFTRRLLGYADSYDEIVQNHAICNSLYSDPLIPRYDRDAEYLVILSGLELAILSALWIVLCVKKYYFQHGNTKKAKAILLPYYDRIVYCYSAITIFRMFFAIWKYIMYKVLDFNKIDHLWYISVSEAISELSIIGIELFIVLLIMQTSVGQNAFRRATKRTFIICIIIAILMILRCILGSNIKRFTIWLIFSILIHGLLLLIYIFAFCYVYIYHENLMKMKRKRNKILYIYLFFIAIIHSIFFLSYLFEISRIDGFCFVIIGEYLYRIIFPIIAFFTIKNDSKFWKDIIYSLQFVSNTEMVYDQQSNKSDTISPHHNGDDLRSGSDGNNYRKSMRSIFGDEHRESNASYYDPIIGALELEINMICYDDLHDISDPFAMGTTAMVHRAKYKDKDVAVKKWIFDEIDLSLEHITEFFRETLFSNIIHPNLVLFIGACLRPPELCLVYEYVNCGDLAHLILANYYNKPHDRYRDAVKMKNRLHILMGIAQGMAKLHTEGIIHRDLKTSNVLVKYDKRYQKYIGKVCDFGSARKLNALPTPTKKQESMHLNKNKESRHSIFNAFHKHNNSVHDIDLNESITNKPNNTRMTTQVGTIAFMAPELLSRIDISKMMGVSFNKNNDNDDGDMNRETLQTVNNNGNDYQLLTEMDEKKDGKWHTKRSMDDDYVIINGDDKSTLNGKKLFKSLQNKLKVKKHKESDDLHDHHATNKFAFKYTINEEEKDMDDGLTSLYDKSVDIFSFGIMMYEIGFLYRVYENMDLIKIYDIVTNEKRMEIPTYQQCQNSKLNPRSGFYIVSEAVYEAYIKLMQQCWSQQPQFRPTFPEITRKLEEIENIRCGRNY